MSKLRLAIVEVRPWSGRNWSRWRTAGRRRSLGASGRIVLGCASGMHNKDVAAQLGIDPVTVSKCGGVSCPIGLKACAMSLARGPAHG